MDLGDLDLGPPDRLSACEFCLACMPRTLASGDWEIFGVALGSNQDTPPIGVSLGRQ